MAKIQQFVEKCYPELLVGKIMINIGNDQETEEGKIKIDQPSTAPKDSTGFQIEIPETPELSQNPNVFLFDDAVNEQIPSRSRH